MGKRHLEAWMDSVRLADLGAILIQDIEETNPDQEITYGDRPSRGGRDILRSKREHLGIVISAKIHEQYDLKKRAQAAQAIAAWAESIALVTSVPLTFANFMNFVVRSLSWFPVAPKRVETSPTAPPMSEKSARIEEETSS